MRAMLLAAGLGTRLLPLSAACPKCLMPIATRPLLTLNLGRLREAGAETIVINTHHLPQQVEALAALQPGRILLSHENELLGSGGALVKARAWLGQDPFMVSNADIVHCLDLALLRRTLQEHGLIACLGLTDHPCFNSLALDERGFLLGIKGRHPLPGQVKLYTFTGLACLSPRLLDYLPAQGPSSIVDGWFRALAAGEKIMGLSLPGSWDDLGTWERLWAANARAAAGLASENKYLLTAPGAAVHGKAVIEGFCFLSPGARVEAGAYVRDSVLLPGARVAAHSRVERSILGKDFQARGEYYDGAFA
jgi:mannose-1-phosphate guanylyltransferase